MQRDPLLRRMSQWLGIGKWERDDYGRLRRGSWIQSYSGQKVWPIDPRADEVHYDDVCVGLARECRYGNHCREMYSVATHSVIVSIYVERLARERGWSEYDAIEVAREGLLHDASEAYLRDIPRPLKHLRAMSGYRRVERRWWPVICERFDLHPTPASLELVDEVDKRVVMDEIEALMLDTDMEFRERNIGVQPLGVEIPVLTWEQSANCFSRRFQEIFPEFV